MCLQAVVKLPNIAFLEKSVQTVSDVYTMRLDGQVKIIQVVIPYPKLRNPKVFFEHQDVVS
jgi:hypothetical protein